MSNVLDRAQKDTEYYRIPDPEKRAEFWERAPFEFYGLPGTTQSIVPKKPEEGYPTLVDGSGCFCAVADYRIDGSIIIPPTTDKAVSRHIIALKEELEKAGAKPVKTLMYM
jgi:hypothetical protein